MDGQETVPERCAAVLPDNPQCALNYHFGMLLGVEDFKVEQGFHVGRSRRHQRQTHGAGVVAGFSVSYDSGSLELKVGPGYAIDPLGRDLELAETQCVNLALWWAKHASDDSFADVANGATPFDLDVLACHVLCLDRPVPAVAEACAGDSSDIAYSRVCERVNLQLVRHRPAPVAPAEYHLLRLWLGLDSVALDATGNPLSDDQWLQEQIATLVALPASERAEAQRALQTVVIARAAAATAPRTPDLNEDPRAGCLTLARLRDVRVTRDAQLAWSATVGGVDLSARPVLLPTQLLQSLLLSASSPKLLAAGPQLVPGGTNVAGSQIVVQFDRKLAAASVSADAFVASEFVPNQGWKLFAITAPSYAENAGQFVVTLTLDRTVSGVRLRLIVKGTGSTPILSDTLIPVGALSADEDGRDLTTTLDL